MSYDVRTMDKDRQGLLYEVEEEPTIQAKPLLLIKPKLKVEFEIMKKIRKILSKNEEELRTRLTKEEEKEVAEKVNELRNICIGFGSKFLKQETETYREFKKLYRVVRKMNNRELVQISERTYFFQPVLLNLISSVRSHTKLLHSKTIRRMIRNSKSEIGKSYYKKSTGIDNSVNPLDFQIAFSRVFSKLKIKNNSCLLSFPSWL